MTEVEMRPISYACAMTNSENASHIVEHVGLQPRCIHTSAVTTSAVVAYINGFHESTDVLPRLYTWFLCELLGITLWVGKVEGRNNMLVV